MLLAFLIIINNVGTGNFELLALIDLNKELQKIL
jgi:hypothetical protein